MKTKTEHVTFIVTAKLTYQNKKERKDLIEFAKRALTCAAREGSTSCRMMAPTEVKNLNRRAIKSLDLLVPDMVRKINPPSGLKTKRKTSK